MYLVDVDGFQGQLPEALPTVPVALRGGGHAPTPGLASGAMLEVHGEDPGALPDQRGNLWRPRGGCEAAQEASPSWFSLIPHPALAALSLMPTLYQVSSSGRGSTMGQAHGNEEEGETGHLQVTLWVD